MYKIHYNKSILYVLNHSETEKCKNNCFITPKEIKLDLTHDLISKFLNKEIKKLFIAHKNPELIIDKLKKRLKHIEAAGGLINNEFNELLIIFRLDKYDLPKGKREPNETIEQTAIREVKEECGISNLEIIKQLPDTYHIYKHHKKHILKQTYWFKMKAQKQKLTPQTEEDIVSAEWVHSERKNEILANTYPTLKEHLKNAFNYDCDI